MTNIAKEIYFWSDIMSDHAEFQLLALSVRETGYAMTSQKFKNLFEQIHDEAEQLMKSPNSQAESELVKKTIHLINEFIAYKQLLLRKLLECDIQLNLPPTNIDHAITEAIEFTRTLKKIQNPDLINKVQENLYLHNIWLPDTAGHAATIISGLDSMESLLKQEAEQFKDIFNKLSIKANELERILQRAPIDYSVLTYMNEQVIENMNKFIVYLNKVKVLRENCSVMGTIKPELPDHMIEEQEYYLDKIKELMI